MSTIGNVIWFILGGFIVFLEYLIAGALLCITIVGIPFGLQAFKLAQLALWPFNKTVGTKASTPGCLSTLMNLIWLLIGGIWIAITHLVFALLLAITVIGIPWAQQHYKLALTALTPFNITITSN